MFSMACSSTSSSSKMPRAKRLVMLVVVYGSRGRNTGSARMDGGMAVTVAVAVVARVGGAVVAGVFEDGFYFGHVNHGEELGEQQEQSEEQTQRAHVDADVDDAGREHNPARRQVVAVQRGHDNYEALEPHTDVHDDGQDKGQRNAVAHATNPHQLRGNYVAGHHRPVSPPVRTGSTVDEGVLLELYLRVPGDEELSDVSHTHNRAGHHHDFVHQGDVLEGDVVFQLKYHAGDEHERKHHGEAREDSTSHEVGREDGGVPARYHRGCKVHRYNGVYREYQRGRNTGQNQRNRFVARPGFGRAFPAEAEQRVAYPGDGARGAVTDGSEVRNQADIPEHQRHGEVGRDGEYVPEQRRIEVHPQRAEGVLQREYPVGHPGAAHVQYREHGGADYGEDGHSLGRAVDGAPPLLTEEQQYGRDKRTGVADTYPPHEVGDVPGPAYGFVQAPFADAVPKRAVNGIEKDTQEKQGHGQRGHPAQVRLGFYLAADVLGDVVVRFPPGNQGFAYGGYVLHIVLGS